MRGTFNISYTTLEFMLVFIFLHRYAIIRVVETTGSTNCVVDLFNSSDKNKTKYFFEKRARFDEAVIFRCRSKPMKIFAPPFL